MLLSLANIHRNLFKNCVSLHFDFRIHHCVINLDNHLYVSVLKYYENIDLSFPKNLCPCDNG